MSNKKSNYLYLIHCHDDPYTAPYLYAVCDAADRAVVLFRTLEEGSHITIINKHEPVNIIPEEVNTKIIAGIPFQDLTGS